MPEVTDKSVVFTFGRFNPPTKGHELLVNKVLDIAKKRNADHYIFVSKTQDKKKNPLSFNDKVKFMKMMFPKANIIDEEVLNPVHAAKWLSDKGYKDVMLVVGSDRAEAFKQVIEPYIGHPDEEKRYDFENFEVINAGVRDPDAKNDVSGVSASKAREYAKDGDWDNFLDLIPLNNESAVKQLYNKIRSNLEIEEPNMSESKKIRELLEAMKVSEEGHDEGRAYDPRDKIRDFLKKRNKRSPFDAPSDEVRRSVKQNKKRSEELDEARKIKLGKKDTVIGDFKSAKGVKLIARKVKGDYDLFVYNSFDGTAEILARRIPMDRIEDTLEQDHFKRKIARAGGINLNLSKLN